MYAAYKEEFPHGYGRTKFFEELRKHLGKAKGNVRPEGGVGPLQPHVWEYYKLLPSPRKTTLRACDMPSIGSA